MKPLDKALMAAAGNVTAAGPSNAWDIEYADIDLDSAGFWDLSTAAYASVHTGSFGSGPQAIFFKPDGTRMYITGASSDSVKEYSFDHPWDIGSNTLDYTFSVQTQAAQPAGLFFKPDGLTFYVADYNADYIFQYDLTTAWDLSTASYSNSSLDLSSYETQLHSVFFKPDGTKMYTCGSVGDDVNEFDLSTAWDLSTATYNQAFSVISQDNYPAEVVFKSDGLKMYVLGDGGNEVNEYDLTTAWDISTASYSQVFSVAAEEGVPRGMALKVDGSRLYVIGSGHDDINEYLLGDTRLTNVNLQETGPTALSFKSDGTKMYICGVSGDDVNEYTLSTAWAPSTATYVTNFYVGTQSPTPYGMFFKPDGTALYILCATNDAVYQYALSTAWDVSTASYSNKSFSSLNETFPHGIFFRSDGEKMYCTGATSDTVNEFDLSTAWDVSTASYQQQFSVNTQQPYPTGLSFKSDGSRFYIIGTDGERIDQYDLTTNWDVSTASHSKFINVTSVHTATQDIFFKPDGTGFFTIGSGTDDVVPWKIT